MNTKAQHFDIIIAGGGLSGALTALSLSQLTKPNGQPLSIAIIEAVETVVNEKNLGKASEQSTFDARVLALSHGSMQYLKALPLSQELESLSASINDIHISDRGYYGKARLSAQAHDVSGLGYVIEMSTLGNVLLSSLKQLKNISWFCPDTISTLDWQVDHVAVQLASEQLLSGELLLACDGAQSSCRQMAKIGVSSKSYQQSAIIANVSMKKAHGNKAFERFTDNGPIALLPLLDEGNTATDEEGAHHRCSLVWTLNGEQAEQVALLDDKKFAVEFEQAFGSWLGGVTKVGQRTLFPLHLVQADAQIAHRTILIGNASHTLHPIAGQGFNLGLRDVEVLCLMINNALIENKKFASLSLLMDYAEQRKQDHQRMITLTDSLVTLFSNQLPPLVAGRNIALKVLNYLTPLKKAFADKTMGY